MDLPTYTNIWRIEKRLYKLYDLRLPMPLPLVQIGVFLGVFVPWIVLLRVVGIPFESPWHVLYIVPPGVLTWMATRPVIEGKRLTELLLSQSRYLSEPRTWCRLTPIREPREVVIVARVWRRAEAPRPGRRDGTCRDQVPPPPRPGPRARPHRPARRRARPGRAAPRGRRRAPVPGRVRRAARTGRAPQGLAPHHPRHLPRGRRPPRRRRDRAPPGHPAAGGAPAGGPRLRQARLRLRRPPPGSARRGLAGRGTSRHPPRHPRSAARPERPLGDPRRGDVQRRARRQEGRGPPSPPPRHPVHPAPPRDPPRHPHGPRRLRRPPPATTRPRPGARAAARTLACAEC
ncbi:conjugal transfer protein [Actinomadura madurae]|uniref:conjugal transfer protein n=1 Tax=Actinomadura madurae TaxID=1993 RepID=UPI0020D24CFB|nr:conjugal transfer protein [Actinomadura madurae]MCQ0015670.1 conjugal transfer protein [Actinomadura madurae]